MNSRPPPPPPLLGQMLYSQCKSFICFPRAAPWRWQKGAKKAAYNQNKKEKKVAAAAAAAVAVVVTSGVQAMLAIGGVLPSRALGKGQAKKPQLLQEGSCVPLRRSTSTTESGRPCRRLFFHLFLHSFPYMYVQCCDGMDRILIHFICFWCSTTVLEITTRTVPSSGRCPSLFNRDV